MSVTTEELDISTGLTYRPVTWHIKTCWLADLAPTLLMASCC